MTRHSSSDFWADPGEAMATTPPRKLRLLWWNDPPNPVAEIGTVMMGLGAKGLKWALKREVGADFGVHRSFEKACLAVGLRILVLEDERGNVLGIWEAICELSLGKRKKRIWGFFIYLDN